MKQKKKLHFLVEIKQLTLQKALVSQKQIRSKTGKKKKG